MTALAMGMALFDHKLPVPIRAGLFAVVGILIAFQVLKRPEWISGWLPPLIAIGALIWLRSWRIGLILTVILALFILPSLSGFYNTLVNTETQQWSSFTRFATWSIVFQLIKINPVTGLGPANYPYFTALYSYLGYFVRFNSHNNYFDIALQYGLVGLGIFAWLAGAIFYTGWRLRQITRDGFSSAYANGMLAGLTAILISGAFADWFLPFVYNIGIPGFQASIYIWLFCGGLGSLYLLEKKH
jgi:O-antigen ligase